MSCFGWVKRTKSPTSDTIINRIDPSAAKIANGLVGFIGNKDGDKFPGAVKASELDGILFIGFDVIARFGGNERWGDDRARHFHFHEHPCHPHAAAACLVADGKLGDGNFLGSGDLADGAIQGDLSGGHFAVEADFTFRARVSNGDGCLFFMHIETDVECRSRV